MTKLSVNLNKVALVRNSRAIGIPSVVRAAELCIAAGAHGITVHPRPDERHIRRSDVRDLAELLRAHPEVEFNIEGNPFPEFMELVAEARPHQVTLVPDAPGAVTSDHGWNLAESADRLAPLIVELVRGGSRVSLFMDVASDEWRLAKALGAERVELYTEPYAAAHARGNASAALAQCIAASEAAKRAGLGVNAGHDLSLQNLPGFRRVPHVLEVSIGHALMADALELGLPAAVGAYLDALR